MQELLDLALHADQLLEEIIAKYGHLTYLILFLIIFIETGLVVVAFFPGDGLLFSAGVFAAAGMLDWALLLLLLSIATTLGNTSNYFIGKYMGHKVFRGGKTIWSRQLDKAHLFYEKYGALAIALSRFFPFMRTLVPFTAGITGMSFHLFTPYNILGGVAWISVYVLAGYFVGDIPWVKANYGLIFSGLILLILLALISGVIKSIWTRKRRN